MRLITAAVIAASLFACAGTAWAEGRFVEVPSRVDHVYDPDRGLLYIGSGGNVLRYDLDAGTFLAPVAAGTALRGMDLSPDGQTLAAADDSVTGIHTVNLDSLAVQHVNFTPYSLEAGTFSVAYGSDGSLLITSDFNGSGWVPLRRYVQQTGNTTQLTTVRMNTMLAPSADRSVIGFAESNISDGRFGRYRVSDGNILRKDGYDYGTSGFNYEMGASRDGQQYAILMNGSTVLTDGALGKYTPNIGVYNSGVIGVAYHPFEDLVYFPWSGGSQVRVYDTLTRSQVDAYDFEIPFTQPTYGAYERGRAKVSSDGRYLFVTVTGGIRYVSLYARAPAGLAATAGDGSVSLSWSPVAGATGYSVYASTSSNGQGMTPMVSGVNGTNVMLTGLANRTRLYFRVATESAAGTSTPSNEVSATPAPAPAAVTGLQAVAGNESVQLSWSVEPDATSYTIYRGTTPGDAVQVTTGVVGTAYSATGLVNGTTYYFQVAAANSTGTGPRSSEVDATPFPPPAAPTGLVAVPGDGSVTLSWTASDTATRYEVYYAFDSGGPYYAWYQDTEDTSITLEGFTNGEEYFFKVAAANSAGLGPQSGEVSATPTPLTTVTIWVSQSTVAAGHPVTLNWVASNASSCVATDAWDGSPVASGSQTLYLPAGTYTFTLSCDGANGSDSKSATVTVTPAAPVVTIALDSTSISTGEGATLSWSAFGADSCESSDAWNGGRATSGSLYVSPSSAGSYTFTLTCANGDGEATQAATLSVSDPAGPTLTLTVNPATITLGSAVMVSWSSTHATSCVASDAWSGTKPVTSSVAVQPAAAGGYTYAMTCSGPGGTTSRTAALIVNAVAEDPEEDDGGGGGGGGGSFDPRALFGLLLLTAARRRRRDSSRGAAS